MLTKPVRNDFLANATSMGRERGKIAWLVV
jgi:hypothetical protein